MRPSNAPLASPESTQAQPRSPSIPRALFKNSVVCSVDLRIGFLPPGFLRCPLISSKGVSSSKTVAVWQSLSMMQKVLYDLLNDNEDCVVQPWPCLSIQVSALQLPPMVVIVVRNRDNIGEEDLAQRTHSPGEYHELHMCAQTSVNPFRSQCSYISRTHRFRISSAVCWPSFRVGKIRCQQK